MAETTDERGRGRGLALVVLPHLAAIGILTAVAIGVRDRLPDRVATHFDGGGTADGFLSREALLALALGTLVFQGLALGVALWRGRGPMRRLTAALGAGLPVFTGTLLVTSLLVNVDVADPTDVRLPLWWLPVALGGGALVGLGAWRLVGSGPRTRERPGRSSVLRLEPGESAVWSRHVGSRVMRIAALVVLLASLVSLAVGEWAPGLLGLLAAVVVGALASVRVTVDGSGLVVDLPPLPRPRLSVPLASVAEAEAVRVDAIGDFGGWGYRVRPGASGVVLRSGEALRVRREGGRAFVVTVDDADTAAALLNGLAARRRGEGG
ncbi:DUF1648 domain-containing protein [Streptomyces triticirhizae]|uniref:DUF1648 domain-containing protein n=1 Tax=Streptomyces triticirhizae TaxID=2483353 RepID=A0A3M2L0I2_9ACTN|nr:DUF1648 domain-containing protein [Streptomyces triticirhizae]RMI30456.1 DUF1648 domain-containing protein [Streptomyces triticirhizae]